MTRIWPRSQRMRSSPNTRRVRHFGSSRGAVGGRERDRVPGVRLLRLHDRRDRVGLQPTSIESSTDGPQVDCRRAAVPPTSRVRRVTCSEPRPRARPEGLGRPPRLGTELGSACCSTPDTWGSTGRGVRRSRGHARRAPHLHRGNRPRPCPYVGMNFVGLLHAGPTLTRRRPTSRSLPPPGDPQGRARVVPGPSSRTPAGTWPTCAAARFATATTT